MGTAGEVTPLAGAQISCLAAGPSAAGGLAVGYASGSAGPGRKNALAKLARLVELLVTYLHLFLICRICQICTTAFPGCGNQVARHTALSPREATPPKYAFGVPRASARGGGGSCSAAAASFPPLHPS